MLKNKDDIQFLVILVLFALVVSLAFALIPGIPIG